MKSSNFSIIMCIIWICTFLLIFLIAKSCDSPKPNQKEHKITSSNEWKPIRWYNNGKIIEYKRNDSIKTIVFTSDTSALVTYRKATTY